MYGVVRYGMVYNVHNVRTVRYTTYMCYAHVFPCMYTWYTMYTMYSICQKKISRPFKRLCGDRAFCVKGPFNLNGRNGRTTAGVDLHRTHDRSAHTVVSN